MIAWIYLLLAAVAEAAYGIAVHHSRGFTLVGPTIWAVVAGIATTILLGLSMKTLPLGMAFVIWAGLAAVGTVIYGIAAFGEPRDFMRLGFIALILAGVVGLKVTSSV